MQDLYGVFEGHKDKPLLSLACTPRGVRMVDAYMAEQGFEQVLEWLPDVDRRPGLDIKAMPCYVFRNYEYPEAYRAVSYTHLVPAAGIRSGSDQPGGLGGPCRAVGGFRLRPR